jgi:hypothetical protein
MIASSIMLHTSQFQSGDRADAPSLTGLPVGMFVGRSLAYDSMP